MTEDNPEKRDLDRMKRVIDLASGEKPFAGGDYHEKLRAIVNAHNNAMERADRLGLLYSELAETLGIGDPQKDTRKADELFGHEGSKALFWAYLIRGGATKEDMADATEPDVTATMTVHELDDLCETAGDECTEAGCFDFDMAASWRPRVVARLGPRLRDVKTLRAMDIAKQRHE